MVAEEQPVKATGGLINRVRLQLAGEFPEAMEFSTEKEWGREMPGIVNWLNGDRTSRGAKIWENRYTVGRIKRGGKMIEVSGTIGIGISSYTLLIGRQLLEVSQAILSLENAIEEILGRDEYKPYIDAMESMNFSTNMKAVWLTRVYPFSKFLDIDGRERTNKRLSNNGRWCTHNQSLAQFKAALGAAIDVSRSGQSKDGMAPTRAPKGIHKKKEKRHCPNWGQILKDSILAVGLGSDRDQQSEGGASPKADRQAQRTEGEGQKYISAIGEPARACLQATLSGVEEKPDRMKSSDT